MSFKKRWPLGRDRHVQLASASLSQSSQSNYTLSHPPTGITGKLIHTGKDVNAGFRLLLRVMYEPDGDLISEVEKVYQILALNLQTLFQSILYIL